MQENQKETLAVNIQKDVISVIADMQQDHWPHVTTEEIVDRLIALGGLAVATNFGDAVYVAELGKMVAIVAGSLHALARVRQAALDAKTSNSPLA